MNIIEYRESKLKTKVTADIAERWQKRVVTRQLDKNGRAGGAMYLESYGKRIGAKKCIRLAVMAESVGALPFAEVIWEKAYFLETGASEGLSLDGSDAPEPVEYGVGDALPEIDGLPDHLQPGKIATLQPQNLDEHDVEHYIISPTYWAQPKIDGHRMIAICTEDEIWYQKRSLRLEFMPSRDIDTALRELAQEVGAVILDGELYWKDCLGMEHRTAAQAATANVNAGQPIAVPEANYALFDCLWYGDTDLTPRMFVGRVEYADHASAEMMNPHIFVVQKAITENEKRLMVQTQEAQGREGVVFRVKDSTYVAGKSKTAYRHKFLMEHVLEVTGLTPTTADGRLFGAIETPIGRVGTGFSDADQVLIQEAYDKGGLKIEVASQGLTENGILWHPRYLKIVGAE